MSRPVVGLGTNETATPHAPVLLFVIKVLFTRAVEVRATDPRAAR